ncbi:MAG TPA: GNAT family N-acetyltransferase [Streptosporangiaceae bacterium]|nr:GNAT family N-acetyltransferase [Streptosporangiaceae bacterium]
MPPTPAASILRCHREPPVWLAGDLTIRRYDPAEFDSVLALHRLGLASVGVRPGDGVYYEYDLFQMEQLYLRDGGEFLVGMIAPGQIVAMGGLRRHHPDFDTPLDMGYEHVGEMVRLRVHPSVQRRGHGTAMVLALEERAHELGYRMLVADTTSGQAAALGLYGKFGWYEIHREIVGDLVNVYLAKLLR